MYPSFIDGHTIATAQDEEDAKVPVNPPPAQQNPGDFAVTVDDDAAVQNNNASNDAQSDDSTAPMYSKD